MSDTNYFTERDSVQNPMVSYVAEPKAEYDASSGRRLLFKLGWEYLDRDEVVTLRGGQTGLVLQQVFRDQIIKLNPDFMTEEKASELLRQLELIPSTVEGNLTIWEYLKGVKTVFDDQEKRERNVTFIDTQNIDNNVFHVTDEMTYTNGNKTTRSDVVFFINGIPVIMVETKAAHKVGGLEEGFTQIRRYHRETPELMAILQIYGITRGLGLHYSSTWNLSPKYVFNWKSKIEGNYEALVQSFLDRKHVVEVIHDYILFTRSDDELKKVILRPHQMRAVEQIVKRAMDESKKRGLVWHTQGSGKTFTMIVTAEHILSQPEFENPTVIMLVDRNELESQLFGNLEAVGKEEIVVTESKKHLLELMKNDKRGLVVTMIHKFDKMPANINTRDNIFVLIDEAHRTTGGDLGNYLMGALPNATYIGFTGTPIDKTSYGKGTFLIFGKDDAPDGYLDKYSVAESIEDGTTVPLHYTLAPNELRVNRELLDSEFLDLAETEGLADHESLRNILTKAVNLRNMMKTPERIERIAKYVANHYKENIEPMGYKAFLVAVDREACAMYKKELNKYLPPEYSEVVYSSGHNDSEELEEFHINEEQEKRIRKAFRKPDELPKILIVTEKLLTGFDAPILYCMYLDKPMRDHVLLQAIARVNRPYEDNEGRKKPSGFVLDFVGIFDNLEKALAFDSHDIEGIVNDIEELKKKFTQTMEVARTDYLAVIAGKKEDKAIDAVVEEFFDEEKRGRFYLFMKELMDMYEIISPDQFLRPYIEEYNTLLRMYHIAREAFESKELTDYDFQRKTAELVKKHTKTGEIETPLEVYEINEKTLEKIEESQASDQTKVFNLSKSIRELIDTEVDQNPYLISIGEKAESVIEQYKNRQTSTQNTLEILRESVEEINTARKEYAEKNMNPEIFSVYWVLKQNEVGGAESKASELNEVLKEYPHIAKSEVHQRQFKQGFYKILLSAGVDPSRVTEIAKHVYRVLKI